MSVNCYSLADIDEAISCADLDNVAGLVQDIYYAYWEDVATFPSYPAPSGANATMTFEEGGQWDGDLAMATGKYLHKLVAKESSGEITFTEQGNGSVLCQLDIERSKLNAVLFGFENATRGRRLVILAKDANGTCYLLGDANNAAKRVPADASTTGKDPSSDENKGFLRFQFYCPRKLVYTGTDPEELLNSGT